MITWITNPTKKRIIRELRKILYEHPRYRGDSENVYNKYSFESRPQRGIFVNATSGDRVRLSADNYMGRDSSFCMLAPVQNFPNTTLEWIRENYALLEQYSKKRDIFPSPPGVYIIKVCQVPNEARSVPGQFTVRPILTVTDEPLIVFSGPGDIESQLSRENIYPGSVRLWLEGTHPLLVNVDYHVDDATGAITFLKNPPTGLTIYADYRYETGEQGPFPFFLEESNETAIPGVVLAFGDRAQNGDQMAIAITADRTEVAEIFGGKFEIHFELVVFSRDSEDREKLSDYMIAKILERQNKLGFEGLELLDISPGGENEEVYNQDEDAYYYESSVALSMRVDWETRIALPIEIFRVETTSQTEEQQAGYLDGTVLSDLLKTGTPVDMAGVSTVIGNKIGYARIR